jgi:hypothetical protein
MFLNRIRTFFRDQIEHNPTHILLPRWSSRVSSKESNLVPRRSTRRGTSGEDPTTAESGKNQRTVGEKCRKSEEQFVGDEILVTERQGENVVGL